MNHPNVMLTRKSNGNRILMHAGKMQQVTSDSTSPPISQRRIPEPRSLKSCESARQFRLWSSVDGDPSSNVPLVYVAIDCNNPTVAQRGKKVISKGTAERRKRHSIVVGQFVRLRPRHGFHSIDY